MTSRSESDDYVNGLRTREYPGSKRFAVPKTVKNTLSGAMHHKPKEKRHGLTRGAVGCIIVLSALLGACCGGAFTATGMPLNERDPQPVVAQPTQAVSPPTPVQQTQPQQQVQLPESCLKALVQAEALLDSAVAVANASDPTLDLLDQAHQAIALKDIKKMTAAATGIREQQTKLMTAQVKVLLPYQQIKNGLATCPRSAGP